ncbi:MAG: transglutaminase, N-terminal domain protein [Chitinophagaceae bacterium]|nr:transglutaminase, N-terminal domain protein [Chitinophagaceae bacterium]
MPIFKIHHITKYEYDRPVKESANEIRIFPLEIPGQETLQQQLQITGQPPVELFLDYWGNKTGTFNLLAAHKEMVIENKVVVRTTSPAQVEINYLSEFNELEKEVIGNLHMLELARHDSIENQHLILQILNDISAPGQSVAHTIQKSCAYIFENFDYIKGITSIETTVDELLDHRAGVCQDFAHVLLQILRTLKIPSRYVSGYICPNKNGMRGEGATHAWIEAWIPGQGWAGIDPTNNVWVTNTHVKLAVGKNFYDCSPVKGTFKGPAIQNLSVFVSVGYEDGRSFEEMNKVKLQTEKVSLPETTFQPQQQQQQ